MATFLDPFNARNTSVTLDNIKSKIAVGYKKLNYRSNLQKTHGNKFIKFLKITNQSFLLSLVVLALKWRYNIQGLGNDFLSREK